MQGLQFCTSQVILLYKEYKKQGVRDHTIINLKRERERGVVIIKLKKS